MLAVQIPITLAATIKPINTYQYPFTMGNKVLYSKFEIFVEHTLPPSRELNYILKICNPLDVTLLDNTKIYIHFNHKC